MSENHKAPRQRKISKVIPFVRNEDGDYNATFGGVKYEIWKSTDAGFGLTANRLSDGKALHRTIGSGIAWFHTIRRCVEVAERIADRERSRRFVVSAEEAGLIAAAPDMLAAHNDIARGGNHLANVLVQKLGGDFASKYPPDLNSETAIRLLGATTEFDVWCCWAAIMRARAIIAKAKGAA
jgi:hypothetical protein